MIYKPDPALNVDRNDCILRRPEQTGEVRLDVLALGDVSRTLPQQRPHPRRNRRTAPT